MTNNDTKTLRSALVILRREYAKTWEALDVMGRDPDNPLNEGGTLNMNWPYEKEDALSRNAQTQATALDVLARLAGEREGYFTTYFGCDCCSPRKLHLPTISEEG